MEAPIAGKSLVGIEIPNSTTTMVGLATLLQSNAWRDATAPLTVALGKDISGRAHVMNLAKAPHTLIAGATGAGKSVTMHAIITSLLYRNSPDNLKLIMVDPKRVELTMYNGIPHLLSPVITKPKEAVAALSWAVSEMERRYNVLEELRLQNIDSYHKKILEPWRKEQAKKNNNEDSGPDEVGSDEDKPEAMPYMVFIIDELNDLMQSFGREVEAGIVRLAQMSRAVGIHLIIATQRPSVNVITGTIKANIPARIALNVTSQVDSRTILDAGGAEKLLGKGDMLFLSGEVAKPVRLQSAFISEDELHKIVSYLTDKHKKDLTESVNFSEVESENSVMSANFTGTKDDTDELYDAAKQTVIEAGKASTSYLQRKLRIGYGRAASLIDELEANGVVGPSEGSKAREILVDGAAE
jgi:S-DNA-T family DNA segregation ATPase FtsK/SpoIIIE